MSDILIIEDNATIAEGLRHALESEGYVAEVAADGERGLVRARSWRPRLIMLDLMLPGMDGLQVLRRLRDEGLDMPVLILSARAGEVDKVRGFRVGADDYVTKPFGLRELLARIDALLRRRQTQAPRRQPEPDPLTFGAVAISFRSRTVRRNGCPVSLRPKEFELLAALAIRCGEVISRRELLSEVWGYDVSVETRTVDTHMRSLRRKLERDPAHPDHLLTSRKSGYMLRTSSDA